MTIERPAFYTPTTDAATLINAVRIVREGRANLQGVPASCLIILQELTDQDLGVGRLPEGKITAADIKAAAGK
jgi:hypothetical protein